MIRMKAEIFQTKRPPKMDCKCLICFCIFFFIHQNCNFFSITLNKLRHRLNFVKVKWIFSRHRAIQSSFQIRCPMRFLFVGSSLVIFANTTHSRKYGFATEIEKLLEKTKKKNDTFSYQFVCSTASSRKKKYTKSSKENEATKSGEFN